MRLRIDNRHNDKLDDMGLKLLHEVDQWLAEIYSLGDVASVAEIEDEHGEPWADCASVTAIEWVGEDWQVESYKPLEATGGVLEFVWWRPPIPPPAGLMRFAAVVEGDQ